MSEEHNGSAATLRCGYCGGLIRDPVYVYLSTPNHPEGLPFHNQCSERWQSMEKDEREKEKGAQPTS